MQTQTLAQAAPTPSAILWTGRILSGGVTLFLLFDSVLKFFPLDVVAETSQQLGIPVALAPMLGVILLACTLLYAWPRTALLGAVLLTGYLGGAIFTHLRVGSPLFTHLFFGVYLGLMIWGGLWLRDAKLRAIFPWRHG